MLAGVVSGPGGRLIVPALALPSKSSLGLSNAGSASLVGAGLALGALALLLDSRLGVVLAVLGFGVTLMVFPPITQAFLLDAFTEEHVGSSFGLTRTVYVLIGSLGPTLIGVGSETLGYDAAFALVAAGLLIAAGLLTLAIRRIEG